ncbi:hypothetical protein GGR57DRAFT_37729 [Xylariaceae sp. FL1272]|nr:hypothetical protein GGR57DRAFT_37729 [Xylariaceae sp. FL1272]
MKYSSIIICCPPMACLQRESSPLLPTGYGSGERPAPGLAQKKLRRAREKARKHGPVPYLMEIVIWAVVVRTVVQVWAVWISGKSESFESQIQSYPAPPQDVVDPGEHTANQTLGVTILSIFPFFLWGFPHIPTSIYTKNINKHSVLNHPRPPGGPAD